MEFGDRIEAAREARKRQAKETGEDPGPFRSLKALAAECGIPYTTLHSAVRLHQKPHEPGRLEQLASVLRVPPGLLLLGPDDEFGRALEDEPSPPTEVPEEEEPPDRRVGLVRAFPTDSGVRSDGTVFGRITYDVIKDPTGKGGQVLKLGHSRRGKKKDVTFREVPGVHRDDAVVFVAERVDIYAADGRLDDVLKPGTALIVSTHAEPEPGALVLVVKNIDWSTSVEPGSEEGLAGVRLMRYVEVEVDGVRLPHGWPLEWIAPRRPSAFLSKRSPRSRPRFVRPLPRASGLSIGCPWRTSLPASESRASPEHSL